MVKDDGLKLPDAETETVDVCGVVAPPGVYTHDCVVTGLPPVQPEGDDAVTVRDCVLLDWQLLHELYVKVEQVVGVVTPPLEVVRSAT